MSMPSLNVSFTEEEIAELRSAAEREGTSLKTLAHDATIDHVHRAKVLAAAIRITGISTELNKRLAQK